MAIFIKNSDQIKKMQNAGQIVAKAHEILKTAVKPGITTGELDAIAYDYIKSCGADPSFKGYRGFPASICASVNEEVIHGIPGLRKLIDGDIISIDIGVYLDGFHADAARTLAVGNTRPEDLKLIEVTKNSFFEGMKYARAGFHLHEISAAIQEYVESFGFSVVRAFVGHGIGKEMHEEPQIPHYRQKSRGPKLYKGMTLAVEPMVNVGTYEVKILEDGWTVVTKDKKRSAHYENTLLITESDPIFMTV